MKPTYNFLIIITLILLSNISYSQSVPSYVPTNGLVGWWGFNGNAQDGSGNGNHGTVNGATLTTDRFGNQNSAFNFNGVNSFIELASQSLMAEISNADKFSISIWALDNISNGPITNCMFGTWSQPNGGIYLNDYLGDGFAVAILPNGTVFNYNTAINNGLAHHFVVTYDGTQITNQNKLKVYKDGILLNLQYPYAVPNTLGPGSNSVLLGARWGNPNVLQTEFWNGILDDIGMWNRALTPQEITNLYNSQLPTQTSLCLPTISTASPSSVGVDSVVIGGDISNDGGSSIVLRGVCYSTSPNPNMGNQRTEDGSGIGSFSTVLRGLNPSTTYYARSYAKNSNGVVVYGNEVSFTTSAPAPSFACGTSTVSDVDNNTYNTVQIGNQCWTQSNLKVSRYRNGDNIPTGFSNSAWQLTTSGAYAIYNNDPVNDGLYGKLYNQYAVTDSRGLCPTGWHVPSDIEWMTLENHLGGSSVAGGSMKNTAMQPTPGGWASPNTGATNSSGFTALSGGLRGMNGDFNNLTYLGYWWSSSVLSGSVGWLRGLFTNNSTIYRSNFFRSYGFSVRCLKD